MNTNRKQFKTIRKQCGLTQEQLANQLGITRHEVCLYELNKRKIKVNVIPKLAEILQCSIEEIVYCFCD